MNKAVNKIDDFVIADKIEARLSGQLIQLWYSC